MKNYRKAIFPLQGLAEGAVHDFINRFRANPKLILREYDRVAHIKEPILELKISGGNRLLVSLQDNHLFLLDMGGHEIVKRYDEIKYIVDTMINEPAPEAFWPEKQSGFFSSSPDLTIPFQFPEEISPEWLYFLDEEQESVFENIAEIIFSDQYHIHFILGGPGTGKSCVLLNLLKYFYDIGQHEIGIIISDEYASYISSSTSLDINLFRCEKYELPEVDILLVDDPYDPEYYFSSKTWVERTDIIIAFDPLQLPGDFTDDQLDELVTKYDITTHELQTCYRQKESVGLSTKKVVDVIAASTPFLAKEKIKRFRQERSKLVSLSNKISFSNPHGYVETYINANVDDIKKEVARVLRYDYLLWKHCHSVLILFIETNPSKEAIFELVPLFKDDMANILKLRDDNRWNDIDEIKGLEYQHVFIFINETLYKELEYGFKGSGQKTYHQRRLLRIPFSRAKDSLVTFVMSD